MFMLLANYGDEDRAIDYVAVPMTHERAAEWLRLIEKVAELNKEKPDYLGYDGRMVLRMYEEPKTEEQQATFEPGIRGILDMERAGELLGIETDHENNWINADVAELAPILSDKDSFELLVMCVDRMSIWWEFTYAYQDTPYIAMNGREVRLTRYDYDNQTECITESELRAYLEGTGYVFEPVRPTSEATN